MNLNILINKHSNESLIKARLKRKPIFFLLDYHFFYGINNILLLMLYNFDKREFNEKFSLTGNSLIFLVLYLKIVDTEKYVSFR